MLDQALEVESSRRSEVVASLCESDPALQHEVNEFLAFTRHAEDLLPDSGLDGLVAPDLDNICDLPERAGPYRIIREIGRGGMGVVCLAKRDDGQYERFVALKLIGTGVHPAKFAKLFWRERQILAQLDHPNIARLLDGGTTDAGQPYYAMEYVEGEPLDKFCESHTLTVRQKLELFLYICSAVSYAHRNLIIHRDLKPKNVLVTREGVPKLLDFGVARIIATEGPHETTTGLPLTPFYASPEQIRSEPLTVATDIYSLGVLLYELLSGGYPYGKREGAAAAFRAILEEAPIPLRQQTPGVPPDLENIVMVAIRKEPERRYATVDAFAQDVRDFIDGFPVQAAPDTFSYRFGKFTRRNRWPMIAATAALLGITASGVIVWREKQQAEMRFQQVRHLAHSVVFELDDAIEDLPGSLHARELLIARGLEYLNALASNRGHDPSLTLELAQAYRKIGAAQGDLEQANVGDRDRALVSYNKSRALLLDLRQGEPANPDVELLLALVDNDIAVLSTRDRPEEAGAIRNEAVSLFEDIAHKSSGTRRLNDVALAHFYLAFDETEQHRYKEALPMWQQARADYAQIQKLHSNSRQVQRNLALIEKRIAGVYYELGDYTSSIAHDRKAAEIDEARLSAEPRNPTARMDLSFDLVELGWCQHELRDEKDAAKALDQAIALRRQVAAADPHDFRAQSELETVLRITGVARSQARSLNDALTFEQQAATLGASLHSFAPANIDATINFALDCFELGDVYRARAAADPENAAANWREALANFQQSQALFRAVPGSAFDSNDREKVQRLPERIADCVRHTRSELTAVQVTAALPSGSQ